MIRSKLRNMTIRRKLTAIIMLTSSVILLLAITVFVVWEQVDSRKHLLQDLSSHANMIADNCKAALSFSDQEDAEQILATLGSDASIVLAYIYDKEGHIFAKYQRNGITEEIRILAFGEDGHAFEHGYLSLLKQINLDGELIGFVYLRDDMSRVSSQMTWDIIVAVIILVIALVITYLFSSGLQRVVSGPIVGLAKVAREVSEKKDYSTRAVKRSEDEVGQLIDTFNEMLEQIQERDSVLVGSKEQLETKVKERTEELSTTNVKLAEEVAERSSAQRKLQQHVNQLGCLYSLSKLVEQPEVTLEEIFQETAILIRDAYRYSEITCVRITFGGIKYQTDDFDKSELSQHAELKVGHEKTGDIEVYYLGEQAETGESPFSDEERDLLNAVAEHLGRVAERKKTGEKLELFRHLIDQSSDSVFVIEPEWGRLIDVNGAACENIGYTREEFLDIAIKDVSDSFPDDSSWTELVKEIRSKGSMVLEDLCKRKDGTTFPVEINVKYISKGKEDYIIALNRDITERKKAEEEIEKLAKFPAENPNPVLRVAKDGGIIYANKKSEPLLSFWGCQIGEPLPEEWRQLTADVFKAGTGKQIELQCDSQVFSLLISPIVDLGYVNIYGSDITERKYAEQVREQLFVEVEQANQELKHFAYIVSHDLKAPLRGIKTLADWIATDYADMLDEEGKDRVNLLSGRVVRMHNLIDGILQYSRVGREKVERVRVDLNELILEVIDLVAAPESIEITVENKLPVIECGETRILQVFQNLLSNAVKYMDKPRGQIRIGCVQENGFWKFNIADNGPGIEEQHFERIFKIFQTLSPRDEVESTGVGLSVVKKIVELYGGKVWLESTAGEGSTFFFTIPKQESKAIKNEEVTNNVY